MFVFILFIFRLVLFVFYLALFVLTTHFDHGYYNERLFMMNHPKDCILSHKNNYIMEIQGEKTVTTTDARQQ